MSELSIRNKFNWANFEKWTTAPIVQKLPFVVLILGILLRGSVWLQQRSIFLDEANLIRNFVEKSYAELWLPLSYQQYAPPLFSVFTKFIISIFGINELATKFLPLVFGCFMLVLFYRLGKRFLSPLALFWAMCFVAFDRIFVDYSTECKQYASDALVSVGLLFLSQNIDFQRFKQAEVLLWLAVGSFSIWFSMPSVFILAGVGAYFFYEFGRIKNRQGILNFALVAVIWAIQFAIYFFKILKSDAQSRNLQDFHNDYFLTFPPLSIEQFFFFFDQLSDIMVITTGQTFLALSIGFICITLGIKALWQTDKAHFILLLLPVLLTFVASTLRYYSIIPRLILFLLPILILLIFIGYNYLFQKNKLIAFLLITIGLIPIVILKLQLVQPFSFFHNDYSELREGLDFIKQEQKADEAIFVYHSAMPVVYYYTKLHNKPYHFNNLTLQTYTCCDDIIAQDLEKIHQNGFKKVWLIYDSEDFSPVQAYIDRLKGRILKRQNLQQGVAVLYEIPPF